MSSLQHLLDRNRAWAQEVQQARPDFFPTLARQQQPDYLWIGCADSRVPANQIVGLLPGELFVHRNVANLVVHTDLNCLSVLQFAVEVLKVEHVIVCGHYGCGGVAAAMGDQELGLIDSWLRHIRDIRARYLKELAEIPDKEKRVNRLCELNVIEQARNVCCTNIVQKAWRRGQPLQVHGWIYGIQDGLIKDLGHDVSRQEDLHEAYRIAVAPFGQA
ncbi:MAG: carbonate dehydratase [Candidatus Hydrogenedentes bacterium]|nr:carbonate dehydratase [Candidatus Hydrogenedentota bacterium]